MKIQVWPHIKKVWPHCAPWLCSASMERDKKLYWHYAIRRRSTHLSEDGMKSEPIYILHLSPKKHMYIDKYWLQNIPHWAFLMFLFATQHETHRWPYLQSSSLCTIVTMIKFQWNLRFAILDFFGGLKRLFLFWRDCFFLRQVEHLTRLLVINFALTFVKILKVLARL